MILITGATGHLGKAVIETLLKKVPATDIAAFVRDAAKATDLKASGVKILEGNFDDVASLDKAMTGIEKVLLISTIDMNRFQQHKNVVDAARKAGVKHIAYTGVSMKDVNSSAIIDLMESHFQTEDYIKASGLTYSLFRNSLYTDVVPMYVGNKVFETGVNFPAEEGKVPFALRKEMGEAIGNVLAKADNESRTYEITSDKLYSFGDVAAALSELSGKTVAYASPDPAEFEKQLKSFGVPDFAIHISSGFAKDMREKQFEKTTGDLETLLGRKPASLKEGLKAVYNL